MRMSKKRESRGSVRGSKLFILSDGERGEREGEWEIKMFIVLCRVITNSKIPLSSISRPRRIILD